MARCMFISCPCTATHALKMIVPDSRSDDTAAEGILGVEVCEAHAERAAAGPFFDSNPALQALMRGFAAPGTDPDCDLAYVEGIPIESAEYVAFKQSEKAN